LVPSNQIHDFNPGVHPFPHGLFWTAAIPPGSVQIDLDAKTASLDLSHTKIDDYGNVVRALTKDSEIASATIDVELRWHGGTGPAAIRDSTNRFTGEYVTGSADLKWSAQEPGFEFESDVGHAEFARIGHERNGAFFT
jgi:histone acetyltransferase (RNA polymerase elongator complex component)